MDKDILNYWWNVLNEGISRWVFGIEISTLSQFYVFGMYGLIWTLVSSFELNYLYFFFVVQCKYWNFFKNLLCKYVMYVSSGFT